MTNSIKKRKKKNIGTQSSTKLNAKGKTWVKTKKKNPSESLWVNFSNSQLVNSRLRLN